jgi:hypothetical protein
MKDFYK